MAKYSGTALLNRQFGALADDSRRAFLVRLEDGPASLGELALLSDLALPTALKHVRVLEDAKLVRTRKVGRTRICEIDVRTAEASIWLDEHVRLWSGSLKRLARRLEEKGSA